MEYQNLGQTNLMISRIGFGCYPMSGYDWGKVSDEESIKAVRRALEMGVNFFDTADIYGLGHSEEILSKALGKHRNKVIIATKFGVRWDKYLAKAFYDCSPDWILKAVDKSLERLRIDCIPLYQIHYPDSKTPIEETLEALKKIQRSGKIKYIGCSNFSAQIIDEAQQFGRIESLQAPYNILDTKAKKSLFFISEKWKMTNITYGSLAQGLLTGKYGPETRFGPDDNRSKSIYFTPEVLKKISILLDEIKEIGKRYNKTIAQVSIRWILDDVSTICAIVGIKTIKQIEEIVEATQNCCLSQKEIKDIDQKAQILRKIINNSR